MTNSQNSQHLNEMTRSISTFKPAGLTPFFPVRGSLTPYKARVSRIGNIKLCVVLWIIATLFTSAAHAAKAPIYTSPLNNTAVGGYDVVSYFEGDMKPIKGKAKFKAEHQGADWLFASQENLDMFTENPEKYQPQYGGYCSFAVARGNAVKGDPLQYHISDGKLYLNYNAKFKKLWLDNKEAFIEKGNNKWPELLN